MMGDRLVAMTVTDDMLVAMYTTLSVFGIMVVVQTVAQWFTVIWRRLFR
jgi:hypothetical protein